MFKIQCMNNKSLNTQNIYKQEITFNIHIFNYFTFYQLMPWKGIKHYLRLDTFNQVKDIHRYIHSCITHFTRNTCNLKVHLKIYFKTFIKYKALSVYFKSISTKIFFETGISSKFNLNSQNKVQFQNFAHQLEGWLNATLFTI